MRFPLRLDKAESAQSIEWLLNIPEQLKLTCCKLGIQMQSKKAAHQHRRSLAVLDFNLKIHFSHKLQSATL